MKISKRNIKTAQNLYERAIRLQGEIYYFVDVLKDKIGIEDLARLASDAAFEMDLC